MTLNELIKTAAPSYPISDDYHAFEATTKGMPQDEFYNRTLEWGKEMEGKHGPGWKAKWDDEITRRGMDVDAMQNNGKPVQHALTQAPASTPPASGAKPAPAKPAASTPVQKPAQQAKPAAQAQQPNYQQAFNELVTQNPWISQQMGAMPGATPEQLYNKAYSIYTSGRMAANNAMGNMYRERAAMGQRQYNRMGDTQPVPQQPAATAVPAKSAGPSPMAVPFENQTDASRVQSLQDRMLVSLDTLGSQEAWDNFLSQVTGENAEDRYSQTEYAQALDAVRAELGKRNTRTGDLSKTLQERIDAIEKPTEEAWTGYYDLSRKDPNDPNIQALNPQNRYNAAIDDAVKTLAEENGMTVDELMAMQPYFVPAQYSAPPMPGEEPPPAATQVQPAATAATSVTTAAPAVSGTQQAAPAASSTTQSTPNTGAGTTVSTGSQGNPTRQAPPGMGQQMNGGKKNPPAPTGQNIGMMEWAKQNPTLASGIAALLVGGLALLGTGGGGKKESSLGLLLALLLGGGAFFGAQHFLTAEDVAKGAGDAASKASGAK